MLRRTISALAALVLIAGGCSADSELPNLLGDIADGPEGELLVQQRIDATTTKLARLSLSDGRLVELTSQEASAWLGAWSPDGSRIAYVESLPDAATISIRTMNADGTDPSTLQNSASDNGPAWFPDCRSLAFSSVDLAAGGGSIVTAEVDGSERRTIWTGEGRAGDPDVSPDGRRVVFHARQGADTEIVLLDLDAGTETVLTDNDVGDTGPKFSPDGSAVVYMSRVNTEVQLFRVDIDGSNRLQLTRGNDEGRFPVWSPDGQWIAYQRDIDELAMVPSAGGEVIRLGVAGQPNDWGPKTGTCS